MKKPVSLMANGLVSGVFVWDDEQEDFRNAQIDELRPLFPDALEQAETELSSLREKVRRAGPHIQGILHDPFTNMNNASRQALATLLDPSPADPKVRADDA